MDAAPAGRPARGRALRRAFRVTGLLMMLVGGITGITVVLWPTGTPRADVSDFVVTSQPRPGGTQFVLPASAPLEDAPSGDHGSGCSAADLDWLRQVGRERAGGIRVSVQNSAKDEGILTVTEIRAQGTRALVEEPVIVVDCPADGGAQDARVEVDTDSTGPAVRRRDDGGTEQFGLGLVAGETRSLDVVLTGRQGFAGTLSARVSDGRRSAVVELPAGAGAALDRPGLGRVQPLTLALVGGEGELRFRCSEEGRSEACSGAGARARVARLWERPSLAAAALTAELRTYSCADPGRHGRALDQVWRGFYTKDPVRGDHAYDEVVLRPMRALVDSCGLDLALAALDATSAAASGHHAELRATVSAPALAVEPEITPAPTARPADCTEDSLREAVDDAGGRPLAERAQEGGAYLYDAFRVAACASPYALVEASRAGTAYTIHWLIEAVEGRWILRGTAAIGADTRADRSLFDCRELAEQGVDTERMRAALGSVAPGGRPLCG